MKRKRLLRIILVIFFFLLIIFSIFLVGYFILGNKIKNIYIYNNNIVSDQEIIEIAKLDNYPSWYTTTTNSIKKLLTSNSYIKDVKVKKSFLLTINIYIEEYKPLFIKSENSRIVLENKYEILNDRKLNLPVLINFVPDTKYDLLIDRYIRLDEKVTNKISEIKYDPNKFDEDRFLLYMNDGNLVYVTLTKLELLDKYNSAVEQFEGKTGILYLDSGNYFEIKD